MGGSQLSYRLERLDDDKKMHSVEIFRNAYAVDKYGFGFARTFTLSNMNFLMKAMLGRNEWQVWRRHTCLCEAAVVSVLHVPRINSNDALRGDDPCAAVLPPRQRARRSCDVVPVALCYCLYFCRLRASHTLLFAHRGDPEECSKCQKDFGRCAGEMKKGTLREWSKEEGFSNPPTPEELIAKFGTTMCVPTHWLSVCLTPLSRFSHRCFPHRYALGFESRQWYLVYPGCLVLKIVCCLCSGYTDQPSVVEACTATNGTNARHNFICGLIVIAAVSISWWVLAA